MINKFLLSVLIFFTVCPFAYANEYAALQTATAEELLLFWEAKDLYVETATRHFKPISQAAENITVVTAKDIQDMNAHTLIEVLNRVTGVLVSSQGGDFASSALFYIQSPIHRTDMSRHVLVLLDGIIWNIAGGNAVISQIPVGIVDRIEIIRGPASSAWGSSLGGVINIITKKSGNTEIPSGILSASYGEGDSQDYNAGVSGKAGNMGYYLFAGKQRSDGIRKDLDRYYDRNGFYARISVPLSNDINLGLSGGYFDYGASEGELLASDLISSILIRDIFITTSLNAALSEELKLDISLYSSTHKFELDGRALGSGLYDLSPFYVESQGDPVESRLFEDDSIGGSAKLIWTYGIQSAVLGADIHHTEGDASIGFGPYFQVFGHPAVVEDSPVIDKYAVYFNDTITIDRLSLTPGIRYDHNTITGDFTSPSFGATFKAAEKTLLRLSAARGFTIPNVAMSSVGGFFTDPNPDIEAEEVWSFQGGMESAVTEYVWAKATAFYHELDNAIQKAYYEAGPPVYNDLFINYGKIRRKGFELEAETAPFNNVSLKAGLIYVRTTSGAPPPAAPAPFPAPAPAPSNDAIDLYSYNIGIKYEEKNSLTAGLFGHLTWWDELEDSGAIYKNIIWDFNIRKKVFSTDMTNTELFFTAHNIFSASYYTLADYKNPQRWVEGGVRVTF